MMNLEYVRELNRGGFGKISLYREIETNKLFVMKSLINSTPDNCQRLIREGKIYYTFAKNLFVVDLIDYSFDSENPFLILPYYDQGTLDSWVGRTNWLDTLMVIQHVSAALHAIHQSGGFHRDVKPPNIFIARAGNSKIFKLGDFGVSRIPYPFTNSNITRSVWGTDGYVAPELFQENAEFNSACDVYSLGITAIELITGSRNPNSIERAWINEDAKKLLMKMTSVNPRLRPNTQQIINRTRKITEEYQKSFNQGVGVGLLALGGILLSGWLSDD